VNGYLQNEVKTYQKETRELNEKLKTVKYLNEQLKSKLSHRNSFTEGDGELNLSPAANGFNVFKSESKLW